MKRYIGFFVVESVGCLAGFCYGRHFHNLAVVVMYAAVIWPFLTACGIIAMIRYRRGIGAPSGR
jgi:hypothetical protein